MSQSPELDASLDTVEAVARGVYEEECLAAGVPPAWDRLRPVNRERFRQKARGLLRDVKRSGAILGPATLNSPTTRMRAKR